MSTLIISKGCSIHCVHPVPPLAGALSPRATAAPAPEVDAQLPGLSGRVEHLSPPVCAVVHHSAAGLIRHTVRVSCDPPPGVHHPLEPLIAHPRHVGTDAVRAGDGCRGSADLGAPELVEGGAQAGDCGTVEEGASGGAEDE